MTNQDQYKALIEELLDGKDKVELIVTTQSEPSFKSPTSCPFTGRVKKLSVDSRIVVYPKGDGYIQELKKVLTEEEMAAQKESSPGRRWGKRIEGTAFVEHTKDGEYKVYLEYFGNGVGSIEYTVDGEPATEEQTAQIKEWLRPTYGTPPAVQPFYVHLNNIIQLKLA